jgi:hypothetical protein
MFIDVLMDRYFPPEVIQKEENDNEFIWLFLCKQQTLEGVIMARLQEIRATIEAKLDKWEACAKALGAQLMETRERAAERVESRKKELSDTLNRLRVEIERSKTIADETRQDIINRLEQLQIQLALGKMEARTEYMTQRKKISAAVSSLEDSIDRQFDEAFGMLGRELVRRADALEAEFSAFMYQMEEKKENVARMAEDQKEKILAQLQDFQQKVQKRRGITREKARTFEEEFSVGLHHIREAFRQFFH